MNEHVMDKRWSGQGMPAWIPVTAKAENAKGGS